MPNPGDLSEQYPELRGELADPVGQQVVQDLERAYRIEPPARLTALQREFQQGSASAGAARRAEAQNLVDGRRVPRGWRPNSGHWARLLVMLCLAAGTVAVGASLALRAWLPDRASPAQTPHRPTKSAVIMSNSMDPRHPMRTFPSDTERFYCIANLRDVPPGVALVFHFQRLSTIGDYYRVGDYYSAQMAARPGPQGPFLYGPIPAGVWRCQVEAAGKLMGSATFTVTGKAKAIATLRPSTVALPRVVTMPGAGEVVAADPVGGRAYVLDGTTRSVRAVNALTGKLIGHVQTRGNPDALAVDTVRHILYVAMGDANAQADNAIQIFSESDNRPLGYVSLPTRLGIPVSVLGMAVVPSTGTVLVTETDGSMWALNPTSGSLKQIWQENTGCKGANFFPISVAISEPNNRIFVVDHNNACVVVFDARTYRMQRVVPVGNKPMGLAIDEQTGQVFVTNAGDSTVSMLDVKSDRVLRTFGAGSSPHGVAVDTTAGHVFVANSQDRSVGVYDAQSGTVLATMPVPVRPYMLALSGTNALLVVGGT